MRRNPLIRSIVIGSLITLFGLVILTGSAAASTPEQDASPTPEPTATPLACNECHLDIDNAWSASPHAHAFNNDSFQERWQGLAQPGECLTCHTTGYEATTGHYAAPGVTCESCHGQTTTDHPPAIVSLKADTEYCGSCHPPTLSEWRLSAHAAAGVGCLGCHNPHSQGPLFATSEEACLNCHQKNMPEHEDLHRQKGVGCVDCHAMAIPPEAQPDDGLVATGHSFGVSATTCVACHTDTLHAGKALPGYEAGAASTGTASPEATPRPIESSIQTNSQQIQVLEAALASRSITILFQAGLVSFAFVSTTVWLVVRNCRARQARREADSSVALES